MLSSFWCTVGFGSISQISQPPTLAVTAIQSAKPSETTTKQIKKKAAIFLNASGLVTHIVLNLPLTSFLVGQNRGPATSSFPFILYED